MNWDKAKTMLILFLLGLNVFLAAMYFTHERDYFVSREDIQVITTILAQHDITLDSTADIPRSFPPVDQLLLNPAAYSTSQLVDTFFTDTSNISQTIEFGNTIFSSQEGTLTIMRHIVQFEPSPNSTNPVFSTTTYDLQAQGASFTQFLRANTSIFPSFGFDQATASADGDSIIVEFRQTHRGYTILPNVLSFTVTPHGVAKIRYIFYQPGAFAGIRQPIIPPTQALFMFKLGNTHISEPMTITHIDLVHNIAFAEDGFGRITTVPYYRIFHSHGEPMLINAITGDIE